MPQRFLNPMIRLIKNRLKDEFHPILTWTEASRPEQDITCVKFCVESEFQVEHLKNCIWTLNIRKSGPKNNYVLIRDKQNTYPTAIMDERKLLLQDFIPLVKSKIFFKKKLRKNERI